METKVTVLFKKGIGEILDEKVYIQIDNGKAEVYKSRKEPYVFDVTPGRHTLYFAEASKLRKATQGAFGAALGFAIGSNVGAGAASSMASDGFNLFAGKNKNSKLDITVNEGDIVNLKIEITSFGKVKIKVLK